MSLFTSIKGAIVNFVHMYNFIFYEHCEIDSSQCRQQLCVVYLMVQCFYVISLQTEESHPIIWKPEILRRKRY